MQVSSDVVQLMTEAIRAADVRRALDAARRLRADAHRPERQSTPRSQDAAQPDPLHGQVAHEAWQSARGWINQVASLEPWRLADDGNFRVPIAPPPKLFSGKAAMWVWFRPDLPGCLRFHAGVVAAWGELPRLQDESDLLARLCSEDCQWLNKYFRGSAPWADLRAAVDRAKNGHSSPWR